MRVVVDFKLCQSNGLCMTEAPEVFDLGDDGYLSVLDEHPGPELRSKVHGAAAVCPTAAITIHED